MKQVALVSRRKLIAQGLSAAITVGDRHDLELLPLIPPQNALLDLSVYRPQVVVLDVQQAPAQEGTLSAFLLGLRQQLPHSRIMLLLSDGDGELRGLAVRLSRGGLADDFVFYDNSMDYLLAKLAAL